MDTLKITALEQVPAGLTVLIEKITLLESAIANLESAIAKTSHAEQQKIYTRKEVAAMFRVSLTTLDLYVTNGMIVAQRFGTRVRFTKEAIDDAMGNINR